MKIEKPIIQIAIPSDAHLLVKLAETAFRQAFATLNKKEDFENYIADAFTADKIKSEIIDKKSIFFIASLKNQWAGYAKLSQSPAPECVEPLPAIELVRMYSLQQYLGCGIGPALMRKCIENARTNAFKSIWLGSWKENQRGNAFYSKMGFHITGSKSFALGSDIQEDHIFVKLLS